ncbi:energy transducer TonB [Stenotrophomonas sp. CFBP8980]|uniref:energy transducer TonB family protein n=1 Tax=Stenotrophomonas sp. CFBP8980 TaxID=3096523 RepID=UPI002A69A235|nr:energy transducer TonB [Stenotrophomonas sp. CFBP8980]MDY1033998.1 energy transducer TonB [Stenotrophomonas sp. CFBP8980]
MEGAVRVRVDVDAQGYPTDVSVETSSGNSDLGRAAKEAARRWTFNPATIDGMPARGRIVVPVTFALN